MLYDYYNNAYAKNIYIARYMIIIPHEVYVQIVVSLREIICKLY